MVTNAGIAFRYMSYPRIAATPKQVATATATIALFAPVSDVILR